MRCSFVAAFVAAALVAPAHAKRVDRDTLVQIISPQQRAEASAHPFVNVIVRFGATSNGIPADPATFVARVGNQNVTSQFVDEVEDGRIVGKRGRLDDPFVQPGRRVRLRLSIRSIPREAGQKRPRTYRDRDALRFRAVAAANQPPTAAAAQSSDVILPSIPVLFDATPSRDPEQDTLEYQWDFGDGATSTERKPTHTYGDSATARVVRLTVSDGQATSAPLEFVIHPVPECDGSTLPGLLKVESEAALEFGPIAVGTSAARTLTIRNVDVMPGTQVRARLGTDSAAFTVDPSEVTLGAGESMPVTVTFHANATGHRAARIGLVACSSNQNSVAFLAHGFGGEAEGTGPTLAHDTVFYSGLTTGIPRFGIIGIQPSGRRFQVDNSSKWCLKPNGTGTRDLCFVNAECRAEDEACVDTGGLSIAFDPGDFCSDKQGNIFILSEDTVLDPVGDDNEITGTIARIKLDDDGNRIGQDVVRRVTTTTAQLACDDVSAADGGSLYMAEYRAIVLPGNCIRDAQESLTGVKKLGGALVDFGIPRIDAFEVPPKNDCDDDYDPVLDLAVSANGNQVYFYPEDGGIYRLRPSPLFIVQPTPLSARVERIQVHQDGALMYATSTDIGTSGTVLLYKIFPEQAESGALRLEDLTPCASFTVPNNRPAGVPQQFTVVTSFAAERRTTGNAPTTVLVNFAALGGGNVFSTKLRSQGTIAFSSPDGSPSCTAEGLVNLELVSDLNF